MHRSPAAPTPLARAAWPAALALLATAMTALPGAAHAAGAWPEPAMAIGQSAPSYKSFIPRGMRLSGPPARIDSEITPNPVQAYLLQRDSQYALLIGTTTGDGRFEAWHWGTFMNCGLCANDETARTQTTMSVRGKVLNVVTTASSVNEGAEWKYTWRLRQRESDGMFELIGLDALTGIEGRQGTRESTNYLSGETLSDTGTYGNGKLSGISSSMRTRNGNPAARPTAGEIETAF